MTLCADAAGVDNLSFLNDDQLLELLENSDLEDFDIDEEDVPQLQLAVANEMEADPQRCPSPLNSDIPLQVRMEQEKLRQRWRIKPWETPIVAPIIELPVEELLGPSEYFGRYLTEELFELMAVESNKYSLMTAGKELNTSLSELKKFFGIQLIMGTIRYPRLRMYWDQKYRLPAVADAMSRNRFTELRQNLHLVDNNTVNKKNKTKQVLESPTHYRCCQKPLFGIASPNRRLQHRRADDSISWCLP
ncbi:piggyBac transposable element-derived protein 2-like [Homalodisca vitripennis]|uniref:piggyBac transposable element-derived protein 2-like n=2 Tax=Homalodisca vitripennis TaxID=197043 RepID=UPI001EEB4E8A|nr:piggyBac transposable element-derived protein 2-like [Homalodisca vitripennis]